MEGVNGDVLDIFAEFGEVDRAMFLNAMLKQRFHRGECFVASHAALGELDGVVDFLLGFGLDHAVLLNLFLLLLCCRSVVHSVVPLSGFVLFGLPVLTVHLLRLET